MKYLNNIEEMIYNHNLDNVDAETDNEYYMEGKRFGVGWMQNKIQISENQIQEILENAEYFRGADGGSYIDSKKATEAITELLSR